MVFNSADEDYFISHFDVVRAAEMPGPGPTGLPAWTDIVVRLTRAPFVSIAAIRGRTRGVGSEFVLACDLRFASRERAILGQPEVGAALIPGGGALEALPRLVGRSRALEIVLAADDFDAGTAERYGWINRAVADIDLYDVVDTIATRIAGFDRDALSTAKRIINQRAEPVSGEDINESAREFRRLTDLTHRPSTGGRSARPRYATTQRVRAELRHRARQDRPGLTSHLRNQRVPRQALHSLDLAPRAA